MRTVESFQFYTIHPGNRRNAFNVPPRVLFRYNTALFVDRPFRFDPAPGMTQAPPHSQLFKGIALMLASALCFTLMNMIIRYASGELHAFQIAFFRNLFGLLFMLPWLFQSGLAGLKTERLGMYGLRATLGLTSMLCFFWGLTVMPLAKVVALTFTTPLFVTLGAVLFLGEKVHIRRWLAIATGFIGTLIILRPEVNSDVLPSLVVLCAAVTMAASVLIIKSLSGTEPSSAIVTYMVLMLVPMSLPTAIAVWQWPSASLWLWLLALGGMGTAGHLFFTHSLRLSDVSIVMPFDFARLPLTVLFAWLLFNQGVDRWTVLGSVLLFASGFYIARREARLNRKRQAIGTPHNLPNSHSGARD